jgi:hypothetical protein
LIYFVKLANGFNRMPLKSAGPATGVITARAMILIDVTETSAANDATTASPPRALTASFDVAASLIESP